MIFKLKSGTKQTAGRDCFEDAKLLYEQRLQFGRNSARININKTFKLLTINFAYILNSKQAYKTIFTNNTGILYISVFLHHIFFNISYSTLNYGKTSGQLFIKLQDSEILFNITINRFKRQLE